MAPMAKSGIWACALLLGGCGVNELEPPVMPGRAAITIDASRVPEDVKPAAASWRSIR